MVNRLVLPLMRFTSFQLNFLCEFYVIWLPCYFIYYKKLLDTSLNSVPYIQIFNVDFQNGRKEGYVGVNYTIKLQVVKKIEIILVR